MIRDHQVPAWTARRAVAYMQLVRLAVHRSTIGVYSLISLAYQRMLSLSPRWVPAHYFHPRFTLFPDCQQTLCPDLAIGALQKQAGHRLILLCVLRRMNGVCMRR